MHDLLLLVGQSIQQSGYNKIPFLVINSVYATKRDQTLKCSFPILWFGSQLSLDD